MAMVGDAHPTTVTVSTINYQLSTINYFGSTISLTKTQRDLHEGKKLISKVEEARVEKILAEHNSIN